MCVNPIGYPNQVVIAGARTGYIQLNPVTTGYQARDYRPDPVFSRLQLDLFT